MGVFEQQHCNYEQVFGQALWVGAMCTNSPTGRKCTDWALGASELAALGGQPGLGGSDVFGRWGANKKIDPLPHGVRERIARNRNDDG